MFNKEVLLGVIQLLGIVGFIVLLFFILIAKYIKKDSERKIFIYSFIAISLFLVVWITITSYPAKSIIESGKEPLPPSVRDNNTQKLTTPHSLQSIENNSSEDSNNTNIQKTSTNSSSQVIRNGVSIGSTNSNIR